MGANPVKANTWEKYEISLYDWDRMAKRRNQGHADIARMGAGQMAVDHLRHVDSEGAVEIIENISRAGTHYHLALNLPNQGQIANLPQGAIVETPGVVTGAGVQAVSVK